MSPATRAAGIQPGATIRLRPGLKNRPYRSRDGVVLEVVNDRLKVKIGALAHWVEKSEIQS
jgi:hypothetical protein